MAESKHVREMTPEERAEAWAAIKRGPKPEAMPTDKMARDMSPEERDAFLREVKRRFE